MTNQLKLSEQQLFTTPAWIVNTALLSGLIAISFGAIFIRWSEDELSPIATVFNRFWLGSFFFGLWHCGLAIRHWWSGKPVQQQPYTQKEILLLLGAGTFFAFSLVLVAWSLTQTSVAISTVLHNLAPIFTSLGVWLLFSVGFNSQFLIGMIVAIGGAIAIELDSLLLGANTSILGDVAATVSAVFLAAYLLCVEQLRTKFTPMTIQLWICACATVVMFPIVVLSGDKFFPSTVGGWLVVISFSVVCQVLGHGLLIYSLKRFSSVVISLFHLLEPVLSGIFALAIFAEKLSFSDWIGFAFVLIGLYLAVSSQMDVNS
ncbi:DMT family transporter [Iningainema tapete]|uniref:DMT family transporter n=1 Tax=Iningainema tapete BLCC-T55 TaxID=2748662 RepID=A0A8J6XR94_9CYAN|nr:DMT family transporter [Iningainema tapete]MBD2777761.1 DMT family transporter [Iningainema tapete BLCC-T55]